jgi:hypothetical protein
MKQFLLTIFFFLFLYLLEIGISYFYFPNKASSLDTELAYKTIYTSAPRLIVYGREALTNSKEKIVILGASNVSEGFRPNELSEFIPNIDIHNLALSGSDLFQIKQAVQLVLESTPQAGLKKLTFVIGIWYGSISDTNRSWNGGNTDIETEMLRYGLFYKKDDGFPIARFNSKLMPYAISAIRPLMLATHLYSIHISQYLYDLQAYIKDILYDKENLIVSKDFHKNQEWLEKQRQLSYWDETMGGQDIWINKNEGLRALYNLASEISRSGASLVLIDLPIPKWHSENLPYDSIYQERLDPYLKKMALLPGFSYGSMRDGFSDNDFVDSAHPHPQITRLWSKRAYKIIDTAINK